MAHHSVDVISTESNWTVIVTEDGHTTRRAFAYKLEAESWAASERIRLGFLDDILGDSEAKPSNKIHGLSQRPNELSRS